MSPDDADISPVVYAYVSVLDKSMASECRPQRVSGAPGWCWIGLCVNFGENPSLIARSARLCNPQTSLEDAIRGTAVL